MRRPFELWMLCHVALGMAFPAFAALLIPAFVDNAADSAALAGLVMAFLNIPGVSGPMIGDFADRHRAHRLMLVGGITGMAIAFGLFALSADHPLLFPLCALVLGFSLSCVSTVGPVFIVGAGSTLAEESRQMTVYSLALPAGQILGGVAIGVTADWRNTDQFWLAAGLIIAFAPIVSIAVREPERRVRGVLDEQRPEASAPGSLVAPPRRRMPLRAVLLSTFGAFVVIHLLSATANYGINNQFSNIMPEVYGIGEEGVSAVITVAGVLTMLLFIPAGRWVGRSGAIPVYVFGNVLRFVGAAGMTLVGWLSSSATLLAVGFALVLYQGNPFCRIAQWSVAVRLAPMPAAAANGWLTTAAASAGIVGSVIGGVLADRYGFNAVSAMAAIAAGGAVALSLLTLLPAARRRHPAAVADTVSGAAPSHIGF